jgi:hypothetical protein
MDVAIATCAALPALSPYDQELPAALAGLGVDARPVVWSDADFNWGSVRAVVVQSTWDVHLRPKEFIGWAEQVGALVPLYNPAHILRWNMHKAYLRDLASRGVEVTPTLWAERGSAIDLAALMHEQRWECAVVKPAISAGANETHVIALSDAEARQPEIARLVAGHDLMIQPYLRAFETEGERSYVFFDGQFSHAIHRPPTLESATRSYTEPRAFQPDGGDELELAHSVIAAIGETLLYARVDLATNEDGVARLQEVELIEPSLFMSLVPGAAQRLAAAIAARI